MRLNILLMVIRTYCLLSDNGKFFWEIFITEWNWTRVLCMTQNVQFLRTLPLIIWMWRIVSVIFVQKYKCYAFSMMIVEITVLDINVISEEIGYYQTTAISNLDSGVSLWQLHFFLWWQSCFYAKYFNILTTDADFSLPLLGYQICLHLLTSLMIEIICLPIIYILFFFILSFVYVMKLRNK